MTFYFVVICTFLLTIPIQYGNATSVLQVSLDEIIQKSQFVFEGKVTSLETEKNSQKRIHTYITFEITDIIKGEYNSNIIKLRFLGGTVGDLTLAVGDMQYPKEGEHGIYFVESLDRFQVNPLYGWSQGHFLVERDAKGIERVLTNKGLPVTGVTDDVSNQQTAAGKENTLSLSKGVVRDLSVAEDAKDNGGLSLDEFKKVLYQRMGKSQ